MLQLAIATLQLADRGRFSSPLVTLQLAGDASSFCSWRRFIDDTSSATLHPLSILRRFILYPIGDASSSAVSDASGDASIRDPLPPTQSATHQYFFFFPFELIFLLIFV